MPGLVLSTERSLIVGADTEVLQFPHLVRKIGEVAGLVGYKIGFEVALGMSLERATEVVKTNNEAHLAIYDHQKAATDTPFTAVNFARTMARGMVDAAIIFPFTGPLVEEAYIKELQDKRVGVIVGAEMTHDKIRHSDGGYIHDDSFKRMFAQAINLGVRDFVVPGNKPDRVEEYRQFFDQELGAGDYSLFSPGFNVQGGHIAETGRVAGRSWHPIVARGIVDSHNERASTIHFAKQILESAAARI